MQCPTQRSTVVEPHRAMQAWVLRMTTYSVEVDEGSLDRAGADVAEGEWIEEALSLHYGR